MEPLLISESSPRRAPLQDAAVALAARAAGFRRSLPTGLVAPLADYVRSMNCFYSNLIEGHYTHPIDIERALNNKYDRDPRKRDLQLEAKAHINVQRWIDQGGLDGRATTADGLREVHRRFYEALPEDLLWVEDPTSGERIRVIPGEFRHRDVKVGRHEAISSGAVPRFMARFESVYSRLGRAETIISAAAAHHRFLWIHPFLDGNGRVARLMSYAMLREALETGGIWSIARGFARKVSDYKSHLAGCDRTRRNDLDGRGTLSEEALVEFSRFFLDACLDQVEFMEALMQPDQLRARVIMWSEEETRLGNVSPQAGKVLEAILYRGELPRQEVAPLLNLKARQARRVVSELHAFGVISSLSSRAPWRLAFPASLASRFMPGLQPEREQR
jgi:Fic family protein